MASQKKKNTPLVSTFAPSAVHFQPEYKKQTSLLHTASSGIPGAVSRLPNLGCWFDRDWLSPLMAAIEEADSIHACVYFFSHKEVMKLLQTKVASVVMQCPSPGMEDWNMESWYKMGNFEAQGQVWQVGSERFQFAPTRMVQQYGVREDNTSPIMHHKFLVFCKRDTSGVLKPYAVWTGSANITKKAAESNDENGMYIQHEGMACTYWRKWLALFRGSRRLGCMDCGSDELKPNHDLCLPCWQNRQQGKKTDRSVRDTKSHACVECGSPDVRLEHNYCLPCWQKIQDDDVHTCVACGTTKLQKDDNLCPTCYKKRQMGGCARCGSASVKPSHELCIDCWKQRH